MPERPVAPHDHTRFSRGGKLTSAAIIGLTTTPTSSSGGGSSSGGVTDHGGLSGLGDDDHTQYRLDTTWFDVTRYGATGDGATDDTSAVNSAIAALNAYGRGNLYFPAGTYVTTGGLTTITAPCLILGDGKSQGVASKITCSSATAVLFTVSANGVTFRDLWLVNTTGGTPSAGAGIVTTGGEMATFESIGVYEFYTSIDIENSITWSLHNSVLQHARKYGIRIRNTAVPDAGDWVISDSWVSTIHTGDAAIRIETSGGGKIVNTKINGSTGANRFTYGIDLAVPTSVTTSILLITNCSIENVSGDGIHATTSAATSIYSNLVITGNQVGLISNTTGSAINLVATTAADFRNVVIAHNALTASGGNVNPAIKLTKCDSVYLGPTIADGFGSVFSQTTCTNVADGTGSIADQIRITGTPAAGYVPTFVSSTSATWQAQSISGGYVGEILISDTPSTPLIFADLLQNDTETDLMYADP